jgi:hypothetical protein
VTDQCRRSAAVRPIGLPPHTRSMRMQTGLSDPPYNVPIDGNGKSAIRRPGWPSSPGHPLVHDYPLRIHHHRSRAGWSYFAVIRLWGEIVGLEMLFPCYFLLLLPPLEGSLWPFTAKFAPERETGSQRTAPSTTQSARTVFFPTAPAKWAVPRELWGLISLSSGARAER